MIVVIVIQPAPYETNLYDTLLTLFLFKLLGVDVDRGLIFLTNEMGRGNRISQRDKWNKHVEDDHS